MRIFENENLYEELMNDFYEALDYDVLSREESKHKGYVSYKERRKLNNNIYTFTGTIIRGFVNENCDYIDVEN